jgi:hypothetical protein
VPARADHCSVARGRGRTADLPLLSSTEHCLGPCRSDRRPGRTLVKQCPSWHERNRTETESETGRSQRLGWPPLSVDVYAGPMAGPAAEIACLDPRQSLSPAAGLERTTYKRHAPRVDDCRGRPKLRLRQPSGGRATGSMTTLRVPRRAGGNTRPPANQGARGPAEDLSRQQTFGERGPRGRSTRRARPRPAAATWTVHGRPSLVDLSPCAARTGRLEPPTASEGDVETSTGPAQHVRGGRRWAGLLLGDVVWSPSGRLDDGRQHDGGDAAGRPEKPDLRRRTGPRSRPAADAALAGLRRRRRRFHLSSRLPTAEGLPTTVMRITSAG